MKPSGTATMSSAVEPATELKLRPELVAAPSMLEPLLSLLSQPVSAASPAPAKMVLVASPRPPRSVSRRDTRTASISAMLGLVLLEWAVLPLSSCRLPNCGRFIVMPESPLVS